MATKVEINTPAPDFTLNDFTDRPVRLSDHVNRKHVLLVFNRGFLWPFCRRHMAQLRQDYARFVERNAEIIVVGPEGNQAFAAYWNREGLPFVGLPDPDHMVLKLYGQEVNLFKLGRMPAQVLVDSTGTARFVHYGHSMSDIPPNDEILDLLDQLNQEPSQRMPWPATTQMDMRTGDIKDSYPWPPAVGHTSSARTQEKALLVFATEIEQGSIGQDDATPCAGYFAHPFEKRAWSWYETRLMCSVCERMGFLHRRV